MTWHRRRSRWPAIAAAASALAACGGGGDNPLGNPPDVANPPGGSGQSLSFVYFQKCINPVLLSQLALPAGGTGTCASVGCHDNTNGTGGAFRTEAAATTVDLSDPANTPDVVRTSAMYRNFFSAQGSSIVGSPTQSRMLTKPLVQGVLHGGGVIFANADDPNARLLAYWISRPMPQGQDEFSSAAAAMFTPQDPTTGTCNTQ
jgi:predicted CxxxxCH...CXXCH cytochrome family protein